ncbi:MAG: hypothetical protein MK209_00855 [Planctomycetes bacterium]|nr:hypothetical protein [Planctomycetota bacterium]
MPQTMLCTVVLLLASPGFAPAQEASAEIVPAELPRIEIVDQVPTLMWGEHMVLRDLRFVVKGQVLPFDPARVKIETDGDRARFVPASVSDEQLVMRGTFALDYEPIIQQANLPTADAPLQFVIGRVASELCDLLITREGGLALHAPGCLDLDFWLEGGPAEVRLKLRDSPSIDLIRAPQAQDAALPSLRKALSARFAEAKRQVPADLTDLWLTPLPSELKRRSLAPMAKASLDQPRIVNLRVGALPDQAAFDLLMLHNPSDQAQNMEVDFEALGWERPKRQRLVVLNEDGSDLGILSERFSLLVPAHGYAIITVRNVMPRGMLASSDGPLAPIRSPWIWSSLTSAPSGVVRFQSGWQCRKHNGQSGWIVFSVADGRQAPFFIGGARELIGKEDSADLKYRQNNQLLRLEIPAGNAGKRRLEIDFTGRIGD